MKKLFFLSLITIMFSSFTFGQNIIVQKTITDKDNGQSIARMHSEKPAVINEAIELSGSSKALDINWQFTDPAAIGSKVVVSGVSGYTFNAWWLNNERISLYSNSATAQWEYPIPTEWEYPIDMTPDGAYLIAAYDSVVQVFSSASQNLLWEKVTILNIIGAKLSEDGSMVYIAGNLTGGQNRCIVAAYEVGNDEPLWESDFEGAATTFAASGDRSRLALCQYSGVNALSVIDSEAGEVIFETNYKNQNPPAFSYDGSILLNGDYSGYAYVYEYNDDLGTYTEKWYFKVGGGGTSAWVVGMDISADGSTLAIGTLVFLSGAYDGEIYVFNTYSPEPLWVFEHAGDQVSSVSVSDDGSLIAAGGYGPLDHSKPDFYLFRKQSPSPLFAVNTAGSFNAVDISGDGMLCSASGKAVHAREFGSGGILYNINSNPGGGILEVNTNVENARVEILGIDDYFAYTNQNGDCSISYIPADNYDVRVTKVGYYPVIETNVEIAEGQITLISANLEITGEPPYNLLATKGAAYTVNLSWEYDDASNVLGYNIYRKTIAENQFPEEPIAFVDNSELSFEDEDVMPLIDYYYAVTALLETDVQSPYSNTSMGWMANGFVVNSISAYVGTTPMIDGVIDEGEWDDAFVMDASDFLGTYDNMPNPRESVMMAYKTNAAMTELYVACINENDSVLEDHDEVALYIDDNNDKVYPPLGDDSEGNYWAAYYAAGNELKYRPIHFGGGVGDVVFLENPQLEVSDATGVIVYEFMIPIGDDADWKINPNENNESGLFLFVLDDPSNFDGYWPCQNLQIFEPAGYGSIAFAAEDEVPPPPDATSIWWDAAEPPIMIILDWAQPDINDFDYFNIYLNAPGGATLIDETIGTQFFYFTDDNSYKEFYTTTVDWAGNESEPSEIMVFDINIGIDKLQAQNMLSLYPNPASSVVHIDFFCENEGDFNLSILDSEGRFMNNLFTGTLHSGQHHFTWDSRAAKSGIYLLKIDHGGKTLTRKLMLVD